MRPSSLGEAFGPYGSPNGSVGQEDMLNLTCFFPISRELHPRDNGGDKGAEGRPGGCSASWRSVQWQIGTSR
jgi:hypothetical protein